MRDRCDGSPWHFKILNATFDDQWTEDQWGRPAILRYDWTYRMTIQRVDEQGNPL